NKPGDAPSLRLNFAARINAGFRTCCERYVSPPRKHFRQTKGEPAGAFGTTKRKQHRRSQHGARQYPCAPPHGRSWRSPSTSTSMPPTTSTSGPRARLPKGERAGGGPIFWTASTNRLRVWGGPFELCRLVSIRPEMGAAVVPSRGFSGGFWGVVRG